MSLHLFNGARHTTLEDGEETGGAVAEYSAMYDALLQSILYSESAAMEDCKLADKCSTVVEFT